MCIKRVGSRGEYGHAVGFAAVWQCLQFLVVLKRMLLQQRETDTSFVLRFLQFS